VLNHPILQFGTSRFLQAHVDLFVGQAMERGEALGGITVVQTTDSAESALRIATLAAAPGYPVRVRGLQGGKPVDQTLQCQAVHAALHAQSHWPQLRQEMARGAVQVIISNTGDQGFSLHPADTAAALDGCAGAPHSFPAKLLVLLHGRWLATPRAPLSICPCELVSRNGDTLRDLVGALAVRWQMTAAFGTWLREHCVWANSLVDRIVSEPLHPVGAVAEPYALWAVERQDRLVLPCRHEAIVLTDDLAPYEQRKLWLLNLGHTLLAEDWLRQGRAAGETVLQAMQAPAPRAALEAVWADEVLPVFTALGQREPALAYLETVRERFLNPYLEHRLADIARNHAQKKQRRFGPVVALAERLLPGLPQPRLRAGLARDA
jgi:tagaturonate reductase